MKKNYLLIVFIIILFLLLISCHDNSKTLANIYVRQDEDIAKCLEFDKEAKKIYLYNWSNDLGMVKWVLDYTLNDSELIMIDPDGTKSNFIIDGNKLSGNALTVNGYEDITYISGTKEDFNIMIDNLKK